jgi:hypothetical protein
METKFFKTYGYVTHRFSHEELFPMHNEIDRIQKDFTAAKSYVHDLAGHIKHEYQLTECRSYLESLILPLVAEYQRQFKYLDTISVLTKPLPLSLTSLWVNFQKKYEFNPLHNHSGMMSFVIWSKIPYDIQDELNYFSSMKTEQQRTGMFSFVYTNGLGEIQNHPIPVDRSYENVICVFPSKMYHCVYPFYTSDDYRISVSGNFKIDIK